MRETERGRGGAGLAEGTFEVEEVYRFAPADVPAIRDLSRGRGGREIDKRSDSTIGFWGSLRSVVTSTSLSCYREIATSRVLDGIYAHCDETFRNRRAANSPTGT